MSALLNYKLRKLLEKVFDTFRMLQNADIIIYFKHSKEFGFSKSTLFKYWMLTCIIFSDFLDSSMK